MARRLRIQYPGARYHVMNRGDRREALCRDDEDRQKFLWTLGEACLKTKWHVHAYCLMSHHFQEQELQRLGWPETDLRARPKGHGGKVQVARRLRQETTMSLKWIAARLHMGSWAYVSNLLNEQRLPETNQGMLPLCQ